MAPNKFATVLNRETNRITLVLAYAVLEWTLIIFLLLNSLFSYLIIKFADYFGLKPPCLLCTRLDHIFEPPNSKSSYRDLICEHHAVELSRSGYCSNHRKLVESQDMCEGCWSSHHGDQQHPTIVLAFRWLKEIGMVKSDKVVENCDVELRCSCCGVAIKNEILAPLAVIKRSLRVLEDTQKVTKDKLVDDDVYGELEQDGTDSLDIEGNDEDGKGRSRDIQMGLYSDLVREDDNLEGYSFCLSKEGYSLVEAHKEVVLEPESEPLLKSSSASVSYSYADEKTIPQHLEFYIDFDDYQLIPVDFSDLEMEKSKGEIQNDGEEKQKNRDQEKFNELWRETDEGLVLEPDNLDAVEKITSSLDFLELYDTKSEELFTKQTPVQEMIGEFDVGAESDETKVEVLTIQKDQEAEEIKREVGAALIVEEHKVEILPTINGQVEVTTKEIDFHVAGDEKNCYSYKIEVTELNANIATSDVEDIHHKQTPEQEIMQDYDIGVESDEAKVDGLPIQKDQESEEIKREVDSALLIIDEHKVGILASIKSQVEVTTKEIDFHFGDVEKCDALLTFNGDAVTKKIQVTEPNVNIPTSDFENVCHKESDELDAIRSIESLVKGEESSKSEPPRPCEDEFPSSDDVICEASTVTHGLHESRDYEPIQTEETQIHMVTFPEPPNPADSFHHFHKEILDNSAANELNNGEGVVKAEELKSQLESERKILRALYAELEEERSAAAVATNETMAMINRLQEEKARIEMEALQYQRMMEEQCEYDQEALQLMNEMLVKREKKLQELETELDACHKKVVEYEEREKLRSLSHRKVDRSFTRSSNGEERDGLSVREEESGNDQNTPIDAVLDPLGSFEEERMSILEQLKVLEEKLCSLAEEEEHHIGGMKPFEQFWEENAKEFDRSSKVNGSKPKQLLPLFDAAAALDSDSEKALPTKFELERKRHAIQDEVDHLYERLQALEADREFVKHCVASLRKGDKGVNLLQEILQHLRDLKHLELQARNL